MPFSARHDGSQAPWSARAAAALGLGAHPHSPAPAAPKSQPKPRPRPKPAPHAAAAAASPLDRPIGLSAFAKAALSRQEAKAQANAHARALVQAQAQQAQPQAQPPAPAIQRQAAPAARAAATTSMVSPAPAPSAAPARAPPYAPYVPPAARGPGAGSGAPGRVLGYGRSPLHSPSLAPPAARRPHPHAFTTSPAQEPVHAPNVPLSASSLYLQAIGQPPVSASSSAAPSPLTSPRLAQRRLSPFPRQGLSPIPAAAAADLRTSTPGSTRSDEPSSARRVYRPPHLRHKDSIGLLPPSVAHYDRGVRVNSIRGTPRTTPRLAHAAAWFPPHPAAQGEPEQVHWRRPSLSVQAPDESTPPSECTSPLESHSLLGSPKTFDLTRQHSLHGQRRPSAVEDEPDATTESLEEPAVPERRSSRPSNSHRMSWASLGSDLSIHPFGRELMFGADDMDDLGTGPFGLGQPPRSRQDSMSLTDSYLASRRTSLASGMGMEGVVDIFEPGDRLAPGMRHDGFLVRVADTAEGVKERICEIDGQLEVVRKLGEGSYACVYLVQEVPMFEPRDTLAEAERRAEEEEDERYRRRQEANGCEPTAASAVAIQTNPGATPAAQSGADMFPVGSVDTVVQGPRGSDPDDLFGSTPQAMPIGMQSRVDEEEDEELGPNDWPALGLNDATLRADESPLSALLQKQEAPDPRTRPGSSAAGSVTGGACATLPATPVQQGPRQFALKCLCKRDLSPRMLEVQRLEASIHQSLPPHPNIVTLYCTYETPEWLFLVLEYCPGQDMFYWLEQAQDDVDCLLPMYRELSPEDATLTESTPDTSSTPPDPSLLATTSGFSILSWRRLRLISRMFQQMCQAVQFCHERGIAHRDLKPENFIVEDRRTHSLPCSRPASPTASDDAGSSSFASDTDTSTSTTGPSKVIVKLTDFGLATNQERCIDFECGSRPYMSYECCNDVEPTYDPKLADVWSLGVILLNMLFHRNPFQEPSVNKCPSFAAFREDAEGFLMSAFDGLTPDVAHFLATRVLNDASSGTRVSAAELGRWVAQLPVNLGVSSPTHNPAPSKGASMGITTPLEPSRSRTESLLFSRPPSRASGLASPGPHPSSSRPSPHLAHTSPSAPTRVLPPSFEHPPQPAFTLHHMPSMVREESISSSPSPEYRGSLPSTPSVQSELPTDDASAGSEADDHVDANATLDARGLPNAGAEEQTDATDSPAELASSSPSPRPSWTTAPQAPAMRPPRMPMLAKATVGIVDTTLGAEGMMSAGPDGKSAKPVEASLALATSQDRSAPAPAPAPAVPSSTPKSALASDSASASTAAVLASTGANESSPHPSSSGPTPSFFDCSIPSTPTTTQHDDGDGDGLASSDDDDSLSATESSRPRRRKRRHRKSSSRQSRPVALPSPSTSPLAAWDGKPGSLPPKPVLPWRERGGADGSRLSLSSTCTSASAGSSFDDRASVRSSASAPAAYARRPNSLLSSHRVLPDRLEIISERGRGRGGSGGSGGGSGSGSSGMDASFLAAMYGASGSGRRSSRHTHGKGKDKGVHSAPAVRERGHSVEIPRPRAPHAHGEAGGEKRTPRPRPAPLEPRGAAPPPTLARRVPPARSAARPAACATATPSSRNMSASTGTGTDASPLPVPAASAEAEQASEPKRSGALSGKSISKFFRGK